MSNRRAKENLTDADLLRLSAKGDEQAFLALYRRHQGAVFRFALHMSGQRETAEEVTQDVFLALLSGDFKFAPERGVLQGYLLGMARNKVRRQLALAERFVPAPDEGRAAALADELSRDQELAAMHAAILGLPLNYREVLVLCDLEDVEYAEAAAQLGCAVGTVRSRLHRARAILGAKLRKQMRCPV